MEEITKKIEKIITENNVVLFMKGTSSMPQCGFSSRVAGVLNYLDIEFQDINVLKKVKKFGKVLRIILIGLQFPNYILKENLLVAVTSLLKWL